jgi:hypothetical protein
MLKLIALNNKRLTYKFFLREYSCPAPPALHSFLSQLRDSAQNLEEMQWMAVLSQSDNISSGTRWQDPA